MKKIIIGTLLGILISYFALVCRLYWIDSHEKINKSSAFGKCEIWKTTSFRYLNEDLRANYWTFFPSDGGGAYCEKVIEFPLSIKP